jgi:hypothetical protein
MGAPSMRVMISDPDVVDDLLEVLAENQYRCRKVADTELEVAPWPIPADRQLYRDIPEQDRLELTFFVRAWLLKRPGIQIHVAD